mmetsp:Transcript_98090/g.302451  ORF Transcript_98090/g.302451 Transcript_98090/m.302451 type:complete len:213 (-) Transcript_98090:599-1237(-)
MHRRCHGELCAGCPGGCRCQFGQGIRCRRPRSEAGEGRRRQPGRSTGHRRAAMAHAPCRVQRGAGGAARGALPRRLRRPVGLPRGLGRRCGGAARRRRVSRRSALRARGRGPRGEPAEADRDGGLHARQASRHGGVLRQLRVLQLLLVHLPSTRRPRAVLPVPGAAARQRERLRRVRERRGGRGLRGPARRGPPGGPPRGGRGAAGSGRRAL